MNRNWRAFNIYEGSTAIFFMFSAVLYVVNLKLNKPVVPIEIGGYIFWLSLGLYLGFRLCKKAYTNALKKLTKNQDNSH